MPVTRNDVEQRRLAAAGRPKRNHELIIAKVETYAFERLYASQPLQIGELHCDVIETYNRSQWGLPICGRPRHSLEGWYPNAAFVRGRSQFAPSRPEPASDTGSGRECIVSDCSVAPSSRRPEPSAQISASPNWRSSSAPCRACPGTSGTPKPPSAHSARRRPARSPRPVA